MHFSCSHLWALLCVFSLSCGASPAPQQATNESQTEGSGGEDDEWGDDWGDDEPEVHSELSAVETLGISGPETPWAEMSAEEREWYMIGKVLPIMKELFARQDGARWDPSHFECQTCHGDNMAEVNYAMPPTSGYRVPAPGTPAWTGMEAIFPEVVSFMTETVTPTMGTLMGIEDYSCAHCHPTAE